MIQDFNGDGNTDAAILLEEGDIQLALGNGDGTFDLEQLAIGRTFAIATGDLNGDGKPDLVVAAFFPSKPEQQAV